MDPSGFYAEPSTDPNDYCSGGYNGGDSNELPDVIVGGGTYNNTEIGDVLWDIGISQDPLWGETPINTPDVTPPRGVGSGGGYSGGKSSGSKRRYNLEVVEVNTNDNVKGDNDIQATDGTKNNDILDKSSLVTGSVSSSEGVFENIINLDRGFNSSISAGAELATKGLFVAQVVISAAQVVVAVGTNDPNTERIVARATADVVVSAVGVWGGPVGWGIATVFFVGEAAGWW